MFYATKIKSLGIGGAIDTHGKRLTFIGYLPVKEGDTVYTDGTFIFGNAPPKGSAVVINNPSGIPVLAKDLNGNELYGYFTQKAQFKTYRITGDDWIVNSDKRFLSGEDNLNGAKIIDAYINTRANDFIVTNGFYQIARSLDLVYVVIEFKDSRTWGGEENYIFGEYFYTPFYTRTNEPLARKQTLGIKTIDDIVQDIEIATNGDQTDVFSLEPYAQDVQARALACANVLMEQSFYQNDIYPYRDFDGDEYYTVLNPTWYENPPSLQISAHPEEPFIAHTTAYVLTSNYSETGLGGVVFASAYGYCFPYIKSRLKYHVSNTQFFREWKCVPFGVSCLYEITDDTPAPFAFRDYGGLNTNVSVFGDDTDGFLVDMVSGSSHGRVSSITYQRQVQLLTNFETKAWEKLLPVGNGFYTMDKFGRLTFYDADKNEIANKIPVHDDFYHVEIGSGSFPYEVVEYFLNDKPDIKYKVYKSNGTVEERTLGVFKDTLDTVVKDEDDTIVDSFTESIKTQDEMSPIDGYYIKKVDGTLEPLNFTPLFYQFKNGKCLYGIRGGKLYLDGVLIGDGIKNFRLQELNNISKAKR